jgi:Dipeptidyl aminopeptidases/acylaminoacyl-peptidases
MRQKILSCLGKFPRKCGLNFALLEETDCGDHVRRLVEYDVEAGERVRSYLLLPKDLKEKNPAILAIHQHAGKWHLGKSEVAGLDENPEPGEEGMYCYGLDLVRRGFVVIAPDMLCFESRMGANFAGSREERSSYERLMFCKYVQYGSCLQTKYLHDLSVAVDVLESLDFVDRGRIGTIGHSLGGQEAVWITWYDERIRACVSSCGVSSVKSIFEHEILHNFALYVPGLGEVCDIDEVINGIAPRAIMITNGLHDERLFPLDGVRQIAETNKHNANFKSVIFDDGHRFNDSEKAVAYDWLIEKLGE